MNDDRIESGTTAENGPTGAATSRRGLFLGLGLVLWILVAGALFQMYRARPKQKEASPEAIVIKPEPQADSAAPADAEDAPQEQAEAPASPAPLWDPAGIEDFSLIERSGKTVTKADLLGRDWIVGFIFTRCAGPCPRVSTQMHHLQKDLKDVDVRLVTITVDPVYDTPERLTDYATVFSADPEKWLFLTGDQVAIYHLIGSSFKMPVKELQGEDRKPGFEVLHTTNILHVDAQGVVRGKYNALNDVEMAKLRDVLKAK